MNADRRKAVICSALLRIKSQGMELEEALDKALQIHGQTIDRLGRSRLLADLESISKGYWPDKPGQIEIAI